MQAEFRARVSMKNPVHFLALGFGSGLIPFMPGTFGSLAALPLLTGFFYRNYFNIFSCGYLPLW
jgi:phosphatidylglycerophosphatase A